MTFMKDAEGLVWYEEVSGQCERNCTRRACERDGPVRFFALLFLLIPHCDSYKGEIGCEKTILCCMKNMVGGRGLCSLHGAMEMGCLLQVWSGDML